MFFQTLFIYFKIEIENDIPNKEIVTNFNVYVIYNMIIHSF